VCAVFSSSDLEEMFVRKFLIKTHTHTDVNVNVNE